MHCALGNIWMVRESSWRLGVDGQAALAKESCLVVRNSPPGTITTYYLGNLPIFDDHM